MVLEEPAEPPSKLRHCYRRKSRTQRGKPSTLQQPTAWVVVQELPPVPGMDFCLIQI